MQFVPANKLSSHREKAGCPLVAKSSSDGEFSSGEENRSRADNHFFVFEFFCESEKKSVEIILKVEVEQLKHFFFSLAASLPPLFAENKIYATLSIWKLKKIN